MLPPARPRGASDGESASTIEPNDRSIVPLLLPSSTFATCSSDGSLRLWALGGGVGVKARHLSQARNAKERGVAGSGGTPAIESEQSSGVAGGLAEPIWTNPYCRDLLWTTVVDADAAAAASSLPAADLASTANFRLMATSSGEYSTSSPPGTIGPDSGKVSSSDMSVALANLETPVKPSPKSCLRR
jgi:hypothetical protein